MEWRIELSVIEQTDGMFSLYMSVPGQISMSGVGYTADQILDCIGDLQKYAGAALSDRRA